MLFSIIVIGKTITAVTPAIDAIKKINFSSREFEVLISLGDNPSVQRNKAVEAAQGEWILFLDNDSRVKSDILRIYKAFILEHKDAVVIGGPSLLPQEHTKVEEIIDCVLTNPYLVSRISSRYRALGVARQVDDLELILCNLLVKKDIFTRMQGFNPLLYPNEENCFLERAINQGEIWYLPQANVFRQHKKSLFAFIFQMFRYGVGRGKQVRLNSNILNVGFVGVIGFVIYFFLFPFLFCYSLFALIPLLIYSGYLIISTVKQTRKRGRCILYAFACHCSYGWGILVGLFVPLNKKTDYFVRVIKL